MRPSSRFGNRLQRYAAFIRDETGSASLEFLTVGILLLVPLVYLVLSLGQIQLAALGVEGASRHAARIIAANEDQNVALQAADRAIRVALADAGVDRGDAAVSISCTPRPDACDTPSGRVSVAVQAKVALPFVPDVLGLTGPLSVPVEARATQPVSAFRDGR